MNKLATCLGLALSAIVGASSAAAGIVVSFTPSAQHVNIGETVAVDAWISGLGTEILSAFDLNFRFNDNVIGHTSGSMSYGSSLDQLGAGYGTAPLYGVTYLGTGNWEFWANALEDDATVAAHQSDEFLLAHFTFSSDADGFSTFTLGADPDFERNFVGRNFATLDVEIGSACIAVGTGSCNLPEPATYALIGLGLVGSLLPGALRRRRETHL